MNGPDDTRRRLNILLIVGAASLMATYWIFDLVADAYGNRFSGLRMVTDFFFLCSQGGVLCLLWSLLKKRYQLEDRLKSERQQAEEERARNEAILSAIGDGISVQNLDYRVLYQNDAHKRLVGGERLGEFCYRAYVGLETVCPDCPVEKTLLDGNRHAQEKLVRNSQPPRQIEISTFPLRDRYERIVAVIELVRDITRRKEVEEEIHRLNQQLSAQTQELAAANHELESFNYSLSHDLRSPLAQISTASELLQEALDKEGEQAMHIPFYLETIRQGGERIDQMIQAMLELSRLGRRELVRTSLDLGGIAQEFLGQLQAGDPQRLVSLRVARGLTASGDQALLRIVMQNLLANAWKYTARCPETRIEVDATEQSGRRVFFVRDNGAGFEQQQAARLFQPFQRLHNAKEYPGDGIGLSTVRRILQRHGGTIWAEGVPGQGATFYFTLG